MFSFFFLILFYLHFKGNKKKPFSNHMIITHKISSWWRAAALNNCTALESIKGENESLFFFLLLLFHKEFSISKERKTKQEDLVVVRK